MLGGRDGVLDLIEGSIDPKLMELESLLASEDTGGLRADGIQKMTFGKMLAVTGLSEESVYKLFLNRKRAETNVTLATAEPKLAQELVDRASVRTVRCRYCAGTKICYSEEDATPYPCNRCDEHGIETLQPDGKVVELFFDLSKLKTNNPAVSITTTNDNRSVIFQPGAPGTAPSAVSMIRALEHVPDAGPKALNPAPTSMSADIPVQVQDAEVVSNEHP